MREPPEAATDRATPDQILQRLDVFRERYRHGIMTAREFNEILKMFQFTDEVGHVWAPGATTNQWYRWDRTQWTAAAPPAVLTLPEFPVEITASGETTAQVPAAETLRAREGAPTGVSSVGTCPHCGAPYPGSPKFCPNCGKPVAVAPPPPVAPAQADICPSCGASMPGKKFCINCGQPMTQAAVAPVTPARADACPSCGASMPGKKFCTSCGARLR